MNEHRSPSELGNPQIGNRREDRGPPTSAVLVVLILIAAACFAGYFLLNKLIDISRDDDCLLAHRSDCGAIPVPRDP